MSSRESNNYYVPTEEEKREVIEWDELVKKLTTRFNTRNEGSSPLRRNMEMGKLITQLLCQTKVVA